MKGTKHIKIHRHDDKRQINVAVSYVANEKCMPFHVVFQGIPNISIPKLEGDIIVNIQDEI